MEQIQVGVLTWFNEGCNCGQTLQAFALQKRLQQEGYEVTLINYKTLFKKKIWRNIFLYKPHLMLWSLFHGRLAKQIAFDLFQRKNLNTSKMLFTCKDVEEYISKNKISVLIVGSDQVWNPQGFVDDVYLLKGFNVRTKISYSPSMCPCGLKDIYSDKIKYIANQIKDFDYIGVREEDAKELLEQYCDRNIQVMLDPVFLFSAKKWKEMLNLKHSEKKYILVCSYNNNVTHLGKYAEKVSKDYGIKDVLFIQRDKDELIPEGWIWVPNITPNKFVEYIMNSYYLICDSFHAMSYAIIFKIPFLVIDCESGVNTKMFRCKRLLNRIGLEDRFINNYSKDFLRTTHIIVDGTYEEAYSRLEALKADSQIELEKINKLIIQSQKESEG